MDVHAKLHPTDQTLSSYGLGKLDDALAEAVNQHLESCPDCRRRVAELSSDPFLDRLRDAHAQGRPESPAHLISSTAGLSMLASGNPSSQAPPPASSLPPGLADHPDYRILRELGQGGMGVVYLAENALMGRKEVLKFVGNHLIKRRDVLERFLVEIRNAARLHHPNVVTAYSVVRLSEGFVLAMEYVEGLDLARLVKARGPLPVAHACNYLHQAALGLQHAHESGMVHRDIKPGNLMLSRQGGRALVKVLDFGLAKVIREGPTDGTLTHEGQMLGTPDFIAPEQIADARRADIRADIYSLGCTLYYLLTAGPPFQGTSLYDILQAHHSTDALPLNLARPEVPVELAAIVGKMMAKEPERRFQEPKQVAQALLPFFKKGSPALVGSKPEVSHAGQTNASRLFSTATQPAMDGGRSAARDEEVAKPTTAGTKWESLIDIREEERSKNPAPAIDHDRPPPWKKWRIAIAGSLFGLIVLGGIIITILDKYGREVSKHEVPVGGSFEAQDSGDKGGGKPPERVRGDAAGRSSPVSNTGGAGSPPVGKLTETSTDLLRAESFWRGTSMVLDSPVPIVARPLPSLWLTIKVREGTTFKAVAVSQRGSHDAEGTFKDGVISWRVAKENSSWEGKLDGNQLVGTYKVPTWQGVYSGKFRLTLADGPPPTVVPPRVPPVGPMREARYVRGGLWTVEGGQLIKDGLGDGWVLFGDRDWTDYDVTFEALKLAGPHGIGCGFRQSEGKTYWLGLGGPDGTHSISHWNGLTKTSTWPQKRSGRIQPDEWYTVKIILRGQHIRIELDDEQIFDCDDDFHQRGAISLRLFDSAGRFKNIKVIAPDKTVLWEGPPDLP